MAAVTTKKPGSDLELQLSFPRVFEEAYAEFGFPLRFAPRVPLVATPFPEGTSELDLWHRQKMMDAHRRVMTGVADTKRGTNRAMVSHQGYWSMPDAVLGQRVYANPSLGSGAADIYKPVTRDTPGLTGGVLRSKQGQEFGKQLLNARIAQLNAIDEAAAGLTEGVPMTDLSISQGIAEVPGPGPFVKLSAQLNNLINVLAEGIPGVTRLAASDYLEMQLLLFRVAPQANKDELSNILEALDEAVDYSREIVQDLEEGEGSSEESSTTRSSRSSNDRNFAQTLAYSVPLLREYVAQQFAGVNLAPKDRQALSRNSIRSLGFSKFRPAIDQAIQFEEGMQQREARRTQTAAMPEAPAFQNVAQATFGAGRIGRMRVMRGGVTRGMTDTFDKPALPREDEEWATLARGRFNRDERQVFGDNSGRWYGQTYDTAPPASRAMNEVNTAARMGVRNPFRAPGAAADARGDREFEDAMERAPPVAPMSGSVVEMRKARMAAQAQAQKAAQEAAASTMAVGKGKARKASARMMKSLMKPARGGSEASKKKVLGQMAKDLGESEEVRRLMAPDAPAPAPKRKRPSPTMGLAMPGGEGKKPRTAAPPTPPKGKGKLRLINQQGKPHRGAYHQMPDGEYHSGAKHTKRSKPLKVAE